MVRKITSLLLLVCLLGSLFQIAIPLTWYLSNYHYVSTELCIYRNNPDIDCNGICQLSNKIQKGQDQQDDQSKSLADRDHRLDLFLVNEIIVAPNVTQNSRKFAQLSLRNRTIWISEPLSPPPRIG